MGAGGYDELAAHYHLIYEDWRRSVRAQAAALDRAIRAELGGDGRLAVLDASCGIGTQALGLAERGYRVHGTDLSPASIERARREAAALAVPATFDVADMRALASVESRFDVVLSADNAIAHLLTADDLGAALGAMRARLRPRGLLLLTLRDYDALGAERPPAEGPRVFDDPNGRRVVLHLFDWQPDGQTYRASLLLLREGPAGWQTLAWSGRSRAWRRDEVASLMVEAGFARPRWSMPAESGFFQPLVTGRLGSAGGDAA
jgi:glycine/sarcosine N-methyltransferase